jgi:hypothetical protein
MKKIIFILAILCSISSSLFSQNTKESVMAKATADSSSFVINTKAGWLQYCSSVNALPSDSVMLETVVQHSKIGIDWTQEQCIGKVKSNNLRPSKSQTASFNLLISSYQVRIEPNGKCYLRLASGDLPDSDPVIIPIRAVYKKVIL